MKKPSERAQLALALFAAASVVIVGLLAYFDLDLDGYVSLIQAFVFVGAVLAAVIYHLAKWLARGVRVAVGSSSKPNRAMQLSQWRRAAKRLGLRFNASESSDGDGDGDTLSGHYKTLRVNVQAHVSTTGAERTTVETFVSPELGALGLRLRPAHAHTALAEQLGVLKEVKTGDAEFDAAYTIQGHDARAVLALFTLEVRQRIWAYTDTIGPVVLRNGSITHTVEARLEGIAKMRTILEHQRHVVLTLRRAMHRDAAAREDGAAGDA